jgi:hypothetical protein
MDHTTTKRLQQISINFDRHGLVNQHDWEYSRQSLTASISASSIGAGAPLNDSIRSFPGVLNTLLRSANLMRVNTYPGKTGV